MTELRDVMGSGPTTRRGFVRNAGVAGLAAALPSFLAACGGSGGASGGGKVTTARQGWIRQFAPSAVSMKEYELLRADGQAAELVGFNRALDGLVAMQGSDIDYTAYLLGYSHFIQALSQGIKVKAVAGAGTGNSELLARTSLVSKLPGYDKENAAYVGAEPWTLMKGKKLGGARGSAQELLARTYLKAHGMDIEKDVEFVDLKANTDQLLALERGNVDFIVAVVPSTTEARVKGYGTHIAFPYDAGEYTRLNTLVVVRADLPDTSPELVQKIVKAHVGAIDFYKKDAATWAADTAKVTLFDKAIVDRLFNPESLGLKPELWKNVGIGYELPVQDFQQLAKELKATGFVQQDVSAKVPAAVDLTALAKVTGRSASQLGA